MDSLTNQNIEKNSLGITVKLFSSRELEKLTAF